MRRWTNEFEFPVLVVLAGAACLVPQEALAGGGGKLMLPVVFVPSDSPVTARWDYNYYFGFNPDPWGHSTAFSAPAAFKATFDVPANGKSQTVFVPYHGGWGETQFQIRAPEAVQGGTNLSGSLQAIARAPKPWDEGELKAWTYNVSDLVLATRPFMDTNTEIKKIVQKWRPFDNDYVYYVTVEGKEDPFSCSQLLFVDEELWFESDWEFLALDEGALVELKTQEDGLRLSSTGPLASFSWTGTDPFDPANDFSHWATLSGGVFQASPSLASLPWQFVSGPGGITEALLATAYLPSETWTSQDLYLGEHEVRYVQHEEAYEPEVIPEPSTLMIWTLLGVLGVALAWWRGRRVR